jgi:hypothetical protein
VLFKSKFGRTNNLITTGSIFIYNGTLTIYIHINKYIYIYKFKFRVTLDVLPVCYFYMQSLTHHL